MVKHIAPTVLIIVAAAAVSAQQPRESFTGEATVNVIQVPVRVIDERTGEPVTGLSADDFVILENGIQQKITNFEEISRPGLLPVDVTPLPAPEATTRPVEVVYFLDLYLMYPADRDRALDALEERYRGGVPDAESVSLVVFDGSLHNLLDRSRDRHEIVAAIGNVRGMRAHGPEQSIAFRDDLSQGQVSGERNPDFYERRHRAREYVAELERRIGRVGSALAATMARYAGADARKVLVAFTPGQPRTQWAPSYSPVDFVNAAVSYPAGKLWDDVAHDASDLGFTIYAVDSSGTVADGGIDSTFSHLGSGDGGTAASGGGSGASQSDAAIGLSSTSDPTLSSVDPNAPASVARWLERSRKDLLISAAATTGGDAIFPSDVGSALERVTSSLAHYYSLAYTADHMGSGKTYRIDVRVPGRSGLRLVHRTAYTDLPAATRSAERLRSDMLFGSDANPLGIRVELGKSSRRFRPGARGSKRVKLPIVVKIPFAHLDMVPRGKDYWGQVQITFFSQDAAGNQSQLATFTQPITVAADRYHEAVAKGYFAYEATIRIEGGQQRVYVGVKDELGGRTSITPLSLDF